jgi:hypothetical protein
VGLLGASANLENRSVRVQKARQPTVKPLFCLFPFGFTARKHRGFEGLDALLEIPACRASNRMRSDGVSRDFAGLAVCNRIERFGFRTLIRGSLMPQQRHQFLQKVVFVPAVHFDSADACSILFQSILRPF